MQGLTPRPYRPGRSAFRGIAWFGGAIAWAVAATVGALLAVVFAASLVVIALMASVLLAFTGFALRARRTVRGAAADDPQVLEARNIGGHSWVAYGWDGRR
jgi:hypothetical protein